MTTLDSLTSNDLNKMFTRSSLAKARSYIPRAGSLVRRGDRLTSKVMGTRMYDVEIQVTDVAVMATCTCPVGGGCKHIAAVLLRWVESPHLFRVEEAESTETIGSLEVNLSVTLPPTPPKGQPLWLGESFAARQSREQGILRATLEQRTVADMRAIASTRGWRLSGTRKADIVDQLLAQMESMGETAKAIYSLDTEDQQVLRSVALHSGSRAALGRTAEQTALAQGPLIKFEKATAYLYHLLEVGLVFSTVDGSFGFTQYSGFTPDLVPFVLGRIFPPLLETIVPSTWELEKAESGHTVHLTDPTASVRAIQNLLLLFEQDPPALRAPQPRPRMEKFNTGLQGWNYVPEEVARLLAQSPRDVLQQDAILTVPPPEHALSDQAIEKLLPLSHSQAHLDFLYTLLAGAALVQGGSPVKPWPNGRDAYLMRSAEQQHAALARSYFRMTGWTELWEVERRNPNLRIKRRTNAYYQTPESVLNELVEYRRLALRLLAYLPDNRWVTAEQIAPLLQIFWTRIGSQVNAYGGSGNRIPSLWYLAWDDKELDEENSTDWRRGVWAFFSAILQGPVHWLGLADLVLDGEKLHAFRLHGLADLYWDRVESLDFADSVAPPVAAAGEAPSTAEDDESSPALSVDKTGRIRVDTAVTTIPGHNLLRKLGRVVSSMVGLFVYKLELDVVYATFESGLTVNDLIAEWDVALSVTMPRSVRSQLFQWWKSYGQTRIYRNATLIEFGDDYALTEMKAITGLEKALVAELSPRLVLIDRAAVTDLVAQLEKAGYTPKVS